jgi:hypothetical protein
VNPVMGCPRFRQSRKNIRRLIEPNPISLFSKPDPSN